MGEGGRLSSALWDEREGSRGEKLKRPLFPVFEALAMTLYLWFPFWPCCAQRLGSHCSRKLVGSCQALPWHTGAQQLPLGESYSLPKPVPRSVVWQPSQPRGCHLAQQVLETPAEKIAAIRLWTVTSHPNKGTPGPWVLGQGRVSNLANLREEEGQGRGRWGAVGGGLERWVR